MEFELNPDEQYTIFRVDNFPENVQSQLISTMDVNGFVVNEPTFRKIAADNSTHLSLDPEYLELFKSLVLRGTLLNVYRDAERSQFGLNFRNNTYKATLAGLPGQADKTATIKVIASSYAKVPIEYTIKDQDIVDYLNSVTSYRERLRGTAMSDNDMMVMLKEVLAWMIQMGRAEIRSFDRGEAEIQLDTEQLAKIRTMFQITESRLTPSNPMGVKMSDLGDEQKLVVIGAEELQGTLLVAYVDGVNYRYAGRVPGFLPRELLQNAKVPGPDNATWVDPKKLKKVVKLRTHKLNISLLPTFAIENGKMIASGKGLSAIAVGAAAEVVDGEPSQQEHGLHQTNRHKSIAIDLDGTLAKHSDTHEVGEPNEGAIETVRKLRAEGYEIIIFSARVIHPGGLEQIENWLRKYDCPFDTIWTTKPDAGFFIDDKAIGFTTWDEAYKEVHARGKRASLTITASAPGTKSFKFSSVQVAVPKETADKIMEWSRKNIPDDITFTDEDAHGREDYPHITVKYGIHSEDAAEALELLKGEPPIKVALGKISLFENKDKPYDVVKFEVTSDDLARLNKKITDNVEVTDTHPVYKPHLTLAYVKKGAGAPYKGNTDFEGTEFTINQLEFSSKNKEKGSTQIPLTATTASIVKILITAAEFHGLSSYWIKPDGTLVDANTATGTKDVMDPVTGKNVKHEVRQGHRGWIIANLPELVKDWGVSADPANPEVQAKQLLEAGWLRLSGPFSMSMKAPAVQQGPALSEVAKKFGNDDSFSFSFVFGDDFHGIPIGEVRKDGYKASQAASKGFSSIEAMESGTPEKKEAAFMPSLPGVNWDLKDPATNSLQPGAPLENLHPVNEWNTYDSFTKIPDKREPGKFLNKFVKDKKKNCPLPIAGEEVPPEKLISSLEISAATATPQEQIKALAKEGKFEEALKLIEEFKIEAPKLKEQLKGRSMYAKITGEEKAFELLTAGSVLAKQKALEWLTKEGNVDGLLKGLADTDSAIRLSALKGLKTLGNIIGVQKALKDSDSVVRAHAFDDLIDLKYTEHVKDALHDDDSTMRRKAYTYAFQQNDKTLIDEIIKLLPKETDASTRAWAYMQLSTEPTYEYALRQALDDPDPTVQNTAKHFLGLSDGSGRPRDKDEDTTPLAEHIQKAQDDQAHDVANETPEQKLNREQITQKNVEHKEVLDKARKERETPTDVLKKKREEFLGNKHHRDVVEGVYVNRWADAVKQMEQELANIPTVIENTNKQKELDSSTRRNAVQKLRKRYDELTESLQETKRILEVAKKEQTDAKQGVKSSLDVEAIQPPTTWPSSGPYQLSPAMPLGKKDDDLLLRDVMQYFGRPSGKYRGNLNEFYTYFLKKKEEEKMRKPISALDARAAKAQDFEYEGSEFSETEGWMEFTLWDETDHIYKVRLDAAYTVSTAKDDMSVGSEPTGHVMRVERAPEDFITTINYEKSGEIMASGELRSMPKETLDALIEPERKRMDEAAHQALLENMEKWK